MREIIKPFVLGGPINRDAFEACVEQVLVPWCRPGDFNVIDNISSHKGLTLSEDAAAMLLFLPPRSPDLNPIENAFANLRTLLCTAAECALDRLSAAIGRIADVFTPTECSNTFSVCGCDPVRYGPALGLNGAQPNLQPKFIGRSS
jgi:hypothetical protein